MLLLVCRRLSLITFSTVLVISEKPGDSRSVEKIKFRSTESKTHYYWTREIKTWFGEKYFLRSQIRTMCRCISLSVVTCLVMHILLCPAVPWSFTQQNGFNLDGCFLSTDHSLQFASFGYSCTLLKAAQLDFGRGPCTPSFGFGTDKIELILKLCVRPLAPVQREMTPLEPVSTK